MTEKKLTVIVDYSQDPLSVTELCESCQISLDLLHDLVNLGVIHPQGHEVNEWQFKLQELPRIKTALRLQRDLEINLAGVAVVLDLLDELQQLREKNALLEKHYFK